MSDFLVMSPLVALSRSPWSNAYEPSLPDGALPSAKLRELEVSANEAFGIYRELYVPFLLRLLRPFAPPVINHGPLIISYEGTSREEFPLSTCGTLMMDSPV